MLTLASRAAAAVLVFVAPTSTASPMVVQRPAQSIAVTYGPPVAVIGGDSSRSDGQRFERVTAAAVDRVGRIAVLDARLGKVELFDSLGRHRYGIGPADGPSMRIGVANDVMIDGRILSVYDVSGKAVHRFDLGPKTPSRRDDIPIAVEGTAVCGRGDDFYVAAADAGKLIHVYRAGSVRAVAEFGEVFTLTEHDPPMLARSLGQAKLACIGSAPGIAVASKWLGEVRWYSSTGGLRWTARLPEFKQMNITASEKKVTFSSENGYDEVASINAIGSDVLVVQTKRWSQEALANKSAPQVRTYYLDAKTGGERGTQESLGLILTATPTTLYMIPPDAQQQIIATHHVIHRR